MMMPPQHIVPHKLDVLRYETLNTMEDAAPPVVTYALCPKSKLLNQLANNVNLPSGLELVALLRNGEIIPASIREFLRRGDSLVLALRDNQLMPYMQRLVL
jgi:NhaP-type Na+/H+ and K+/H+ antiporter